jgi:hypothetical protein
MNLPSLEPILPEDSGPLPPARERRKRRAVVIPDGTDRVAFLNMLSQRVVPSFDFFLFSLLSGLVLAAGLLLDSPALVFLAALLAPFMAPVVGVALGTITSSARFWGQALASLLVSGLMVFISGLLAGWMSIFLPPVHLLQATFFARFEWSGFLVISLGIGLTTYLVVRNPEKRPLISSAAIAYGLYLPAGAAGFGLGAGLPAIWHGALGLFVFHLLWAALLGTFLLIFLGQRPLHSAGYLLTVLYAGLALLAFMLIQFLSPQPIVLAAAGTPTVAPTALSALTIETTAVPLPSASNAAATSSPTASQTPRPPSATPTNTLVPTNTPTLTITAMPTPVWARITAKEGNGALIREKPDYNATIVQSLLNGNLVEVLADVFNTGGITWVRVRTVDGKEGWIVRSLLTTATPAPNW